MLNKNTLILILIAAVIFLGLSQIKSCQKVSDMEAYYHAVGDTLKLTRNKLGQQQATIQTLVIDNATFLKTSAGKDSSITWLQKVVATQRRVMAATVIADETFDFGAGKTNVVLSDTSIHAPNEVSKEFPEYTYQWMNQWSKGSIKATHDSIYHDFVVFNKFELKTYQTGGLFKKETVVSSVLNLNPNTSTTEFRTFEIQVNAHKGRYFCLGIIADELIRFGIRSLKLK